MITEDYVSFEVAKLLKEKGFDEKCRSYYFGSSGRYSRCALEIKTNDFRDGEILRPTHQMACKWLREVHNIFIEIYLPSHSEHEDTIYHGTYSFDIFNLNTKVYVYCTWNEKEFNSYEEAVEVALKYALENLI